MIILIYQFFYRIMLFKVITSMKYMVRFVPTVARPIVNWRARNEVIACGLMDKDDRPIIIYSPLDQSNHKLNALHGWKKISHTLEAPRQFVGSLVVQHFMPKSSIGRHYKLSANRQGDNKKVFSPRIWMKGVTKYDRSILQIKQKDDRLEFFWPHSSRQYRAMIYFLIFANSSGQGFGIYTREKKLTYPQMSEVALYLNSDRLLAKREKYNATLIFVDYEGWVPLVSTQEFIHQL